MKKTTQSILLIVALITLGSMSAYAQPTVAAPTPPDRTASKVISFFSDAYTTVSGVFNPAWGQTTVVSTVQVAGNSTLKYATLNYQGTEFPSVNALTMKKLHIDVWSSNATTLQITPISHGPKEKLVTLTPLTLNQWNSYDIDLSQFTGVDFSDIFQFKMVGNGTVYIDNLYFYDNNTTIDTEAPTAFTATKGIVTSDAVDILLNATDNSGAVDYIITYGTKTLTVGAVSGIQKTYSIVGLSNNTDYSFSIVAKDITGNIAANSPLVLTAKTASGVIPPAPTPSHAASHVVSIFSDTYTSAAPSAIYFPWWEQTTIATKVNLEVGNSALKYANLNYQGMELGLNVNASAMTMLHLDVFTENETSLKVTPISSSPAKEFLVALTPLNINAWNSFNIPLTSFTGVDKSKIYQFKFVGSGGKTVFIDNLYFHNVTTAIENVYADKSIVVYPTSVSANLNIRSEKEMSQVIVRNLLGQNLKTIAVSGLEKSIDVSTLSPGNYFVTVKLANGLVSTKKIVKL